MRLCNHPNEVPHVCTCVLTCGCRSTTCPPTPEDLTHAREVFQELGQALVHETGEE